MQNLASGVQLRPPDVVEEPPLVPLVVPEVPTPPEVEPLTPPELLPLVEVLTPPEVEPLAADVLPLALPVALALVPAAVAPPVLLHAARIKAVEAAKILIGPPCKESRRGH